MTNTLTRTSRSNTGTQSSIVQKLQPKNIAEFLICTLFRTSHDGILTETHNALHELYRHTSSSELFAYTKSRLDDVLRKLECLLLMDKSSSDVKSSYNFEINFTTLRRSAGFPLAVTALTCFCRESNLFRVSVPRLLDVARTERSYENENVVSAVVCATNALRVLLSGTSANVSSFQPYVGAITSLAIRNLKSRNYSVRAASLHLYGVAVRKVLGGNIVKWAPRAVDAPCLNTIEQKYPDLTNGILKIMKGAVKMRSQPTDLVASLVFLRRADVSSSIHEAAKMSETERTALELARHAKSWRVRAKASDALCSISDSRVLCEIFVEEARIIGEIECDVRSQVVVFRDTNRVHGSLLILEHILQELSRRNVEDSKRCRDIVARSLKRKHSIWFKSDVVIASEVISSAFWNLVASITLPSAVLDAGVIGTDLVREMSIGLSNVSTSYVLFLSSYVLHTIIHINLQKKHTHSYNALGTFGGVDRIQGGWHSCTWSAIPDDLLHRKRNFETKDVLIRRTLTWKQSSSSESEELRSMAYRTARSRNFKRVRSIDLESVSLSHFLVRSMLLDRAVSNLSHSDFMCALCSLRSISCVSMKNVNGILKLCEIHYGSSVARSLIEAP